MFMVLNNNKSGLNLGLRVGYNFQEKKTPKTPVTVIQIDKQ